LVAHRRKRHAWLQVDDESPARGVADPGATLLNTNARLWIGELHPQKLWQPPCLPNK